LDLLSIALPFAIVLLSLTIHEAAHAWSADRLGDPTARLLGRISLNPARHIDPIGTILLPLIAAYSGLPIIGWAKPVPVNVSRLRRGRRDFMLVAAAGPASNLLQALIASLVLRGLLSSGTASALSLNICVTYVVINLLLAFFNLIPVPPLDGGNVLAGLLPRSAASVFNQIRPYGFVLLYALILSNGFRLIVMPPYEFILSWLPTH